MNTSISSVPAAPNTTRWGSLELSPFSEIQRNNWSTLPRFDCVPTDSLGLGVNPYLNMVVRRPDEFSNRAVPVGMVSKKYKIVQHSEVLEYAFDFASRISGGTHGKVHFSTTQNGERAMLRIDLGEKWAFGPDGNSVRLQILARNSVDGSSALQLHLGWLRMVCSNGMIVGVTLGKAMMAHRESSDLYRAFAPLRRQLKFASDERHNLELWAHSSVSMDAVRKWADTVVRKKWNTLSAARVWNICRSGRDARFIPPFQKALPSHRKVKLLDVVPGAQPSARTFYDVAQCLSWVASRRTDVEEAESYQRDIGSFMSMLEN